MSDRKSLAELLRSEDGIADDPAARRDARAAVLRFFRAIGTKDMAALAEAVTDDIVYEMPFSESGSTAPGAYRRFEGRDQVVEFWTMTSAAGLTVAPAEDVELSTLGDGSRLFIEQRGNMTTADGKTYRNRYVFRFDVRGGRVAHVREYINPIISAYAFARPIAGGLIVDTVPA